MNLRSLIALLLLALCVAPLAANAGNFKISPLRIELSPSAATDSLDLTNMGDQPVTVQAQAVLWKQKEDGSFDQQPAPELIVFPKILTIQPGKPLTLRVGYQGKWAEDEEKFYRVLVKEIPREDSAAPGQEQATASLKVALQLSVPVIVRTPALKKEPPQPALESLAIKQGRLVLGVRNNGRTHFQLGKIEYSLLDADDGQLVALGETGSYVLPGARGWFTAKPERPICLSVAKVAVRATVDKTVVENTFPITERDCTEPEKPGARSEKDKKP